MLAQYIVNSGTHFKHLGPSVLQGKVKAQGKGLVQALQSVDFKRLLRWPAQETKGMSRLRLLWKFPQHKV